MVEAFGATASVPFVGRATELAALRSWWFADPAHRGTKLVSIVGEPGVGKTRLAQQFATQLRAEGVTVLEGAATDNRFLPYEPWVKALRNLHRGTALAVDVDADDRHQVAGIPWLRDLLGSRAAGTAGTPDESAVAAAVVHLLEDLVRRGPVVVFLDDLHWADAASVRLVEQVRRASIEGLGLVTVERRAPAVRSGAAHEPAQPPRHEVVVGRFGREDCAALVRSAMRRDASEELVDAVWDVSGGNAFVAESILQLVARDGSARFAGVEQLPGTAAAIWAERFAELPSDVMDVLCVAAVIGTVFERGLLAVALPRGSHDEALRTAAARSLIEPADGSGHAWRFAHALLREHLYDGLTRTRRLRLHRTVARALERGAVDGPSDRSAQLAHHWERSGASGRAHALRHTIDAARWAFQQGSPVESRALGANAARLLDELAAEDAVGPDELARRRFVLGDLLLRVGDPAGTELMALAVEHYETAEDVEALARIADALLRAGKSMGQHDLGNVLAVRLVPRLDVVDPRLRSRVLARLTRVLEGRVGADAFIGRISATALRLARESGDPETLAIALYCAGGIEPWGDDRLRHARELVELGDAVGNLEFSILGRHMLCTHSMDHGDMVTADRVFDELCELARRAPRGYAGAVRNADLARLAELLVLNQRAIRAQLRGAFAEQERVIGELAAFEDAGGVEVDRLGSVLTSLTALLAFDRGQLRDHVDAVVAFADEQPETTQRQVTAGFALAWVGRMDESRRYYEPVIRSGLATVTPEQSMAFVLIFLAWTAQLHRDAEGGRLVERRLEPFSGRASCYFGGCLGPADFGLGLAAWARGDRPRALERFAAALDQAQRWQARPMVARSHLARGQVMAEMGADRASVRSEAEAAHRLASTLGMADVVEAASALCRTPAHRTTA